MQSPPLNIRNHRTIAGVRAHERRARPPQTRHFTPLIIGIGISTITVLCLLLLAATTKITEPIAMTNGMVGTKDSGATIEIHAPRGEGCQQRRFDNATGRMTESNVPCASPAFDGNGRPIIKGTSGRLNEIGKSFHNR